MVDNFEYLAGVFDNLVDKEDFYFVQIIQRKKDGHPISKVIKNFYFFTEGEFLKEESYIKELCDNNNARAYFWINPRNTFKIACESVKQFIELIETKNTKSGISVYEHATGIGRSYNYDKLLVVDVDMKDSVQKIIRVINECRGRENRIKHIIPTLHGAHIISEKFDVAQFYQKLALYKLESVDIHQDNSTLLYYNEICGKQ